jgi:hypothetical protein
MIPMIGLAIRYLTVVSPTSAWLIYDDSMRSHELRSIVVQVLYITCLVGGATLETVMYGTVRLF